MLSLVRLLVALLAVAAAAPALAHPHVWVTAKAELVYGRDGKLAAVRHHWTFDEAYSSFAVEGLDQNGDGKTSPDELAELAKTNLASLVEYGYFTALKANGVRQTFGEPRDASMSFEGGKLTLHFELPLAAAAGGRTVVLDVYDPTFFVDFQTAAGEDAVTLAGAPGGCSLRVTRPKQVAPPEGQPLSETLYQSLTAKDGFAQQFASRSMAICP